MVIYFVHAFPLHRIEKSIKHLQHLAASLHNSFPALNKWRLNISPAPRWYGPMALAPRSVSPAEPELLGATAVPRRGDLGRWNMAKHVTKLNWLAIKLSWLKLSTGSLQNITQPSKYSEGRSIESSHIFRICPDALFPHCLVCLSPGPNGTDSEATSEIDEGVGNHLFTVESASTASRSSFGQWEAGFVTRVGRIWERRLVSLGKTRHDKCLQVWPEESMKLRILEGRMWRKGWYVFNLEKNAMNHCDDTMMSITSDWTMSQETRTLPYLGLSTVKFWSSTAYSTVMVSGTVFRDWRADLEL